MDIPKHLRGNAQIWAFPPSVKEVPHRKKQCLLIAIHNRLLDIAATALLNNVTADAVDIRSFLLTSSRHLTVSLYAYRRRYLVRGPS